MSKDNILFSDIFEIKDIDPEGKKFDRVSRLKARSENYEMDLTLDYNNELYPLEINDKFSLVLASTLSMDGVGSTASAGADKPMTWRERLAGERDLSDEYEYVTYGKVYRFDEIGSGGGGLGAGQKVAVFISYGGLLMCLEGDFRHLQSISVGQNLYCLIRK
ncbi:RNA polymerase [Jimgerdemannia flammicorona]|uniref:DNA-directed RNA polymerases I, II, and III subunit RPABC3 n=1 Tax=Jimgerdemannia flammicorona TaxID=994334 RepID=A0A433QUA7_9FUNG|nr:RNA polymerase [Jimgerdemannia flammicorona]